MYLNVGLIIHAYQCLVPFPCNGYDKKLLMHDKEFTFLINAIVFHVTVCIADHFLNMHWKSQVFPSETGRDFFHL